jgi:hypothetical protein
MKITDITWETDGLEPEELGLPTEVELPEDIDADDDDAINDFLSDTYGWLTIDWFIRGRYEVYDHNDEVIDDLDDLKLAQVSAEYDNAKFILDTETNEVVWGKTDD